MIKVTAQFEGETVRLTAQSVRGLDKMASQTSAGLEITLNTDKPIAALQDALRDARRGRGQVKIVVRSPQYETHIDLRNNSISVTPELLHAVYSIPGIVEVQEI